MEPSPIPSFTLDVTKPFVVTPPLSLSAPGSSPQSATTNDVPKSPKRKREPSIYQNQNSQAQAGAEAAATTPVEKKENAQVWRGNAKKRHFTPIPGTDEVFVHCFLGCGVTYRTPARLSKHGVYRPPRDPVKKKEWHRAIRRLNSHESQRCPNNPLVVKKRADRVKARGYHGNAYRVPRSPQKKQKRQPSQFVIPQNGGKNDFAGKQSDFYADAMTFDEKNNHSLSDSRPRGQRESLSGRVRRSPSIWDDTMEGSGNNLPPPPPPSGQRRPSSSKGLEFPLRCYDGMMWLTAGESEWVHFNLPRASTMPKTGIRTALDVLYHKQRTENNIIRAKERRKSNGKELFGSSIQSVKAFVTQPPSLSQQLSNHQSKRERARSGNLRRYGSSKHSVKMDTDNVMKRIDTLNFDFDFLQGTGSTNSLGLGPYLKASTSGNSVGLGLNLDFDEFAGASKSPSPIPFDFLPDI
eukprot:g757.t1